MRIPYARQNIFEEDIQAVVEVLKSDFLTQGPVVENFESAIANYCGASHGVAVNSGTSALHVACLALEVGIDDYVWTSPITFVATANAALYCGAKVDFVDIDPKTSNMCPLRLEEKLIQAEKDGRLPKVVIPVHIAGQATHLKEIHKLSKKYDFKIIEDASHAIGAKYDNNPIGGCHYSDITVFSFHPVKIITSGEGGMAVTNTIEYAQKMARLRSHGITRDPDFMENKPDGGWFYEQLELGFNYRMTDIQAALGLSQFKRLDSFIEERQKISKFYNENIRFEGVDLNIDVDGSYSAKHLFVIRVNEKASFDRSKLYNKFILEGIGVNVHYRPIYQQQYYMQFQHNALDYLESENYYKQALSIPMYVGLTENQQEQIIEVINKPSGYQNIF